MKSGVTLVNKEAGMTSFDCIRVLKKAWGRTDLGHGGTLDRFATGLLPVFSGEGLKLARFFMEDYPNLPTYWKTYAGVFFLGRSTETGDPEGATLKESAPPALSRERVQAAMTSFTNTMYEQVPPKYSAKKIDGERASDLAREGKTPKLEPVQVAIRRFECAAVRENKVYFEVECSKGTYVRALAEDLAQRLETVAHVESLCRLAIGKFNVSEASTLADITAKPADSAILGMDKASSFLPDFALLAVDVDQIARGKNDSVLARLSNSGLSPNAYRGVRHRADGTTEPIALFELSPDRRARFLRGFKFDSVVS